MFSELNPWLEVINSDVPSLVVYANGEVITSRRQLRRAMISLDRLARLQTDLRLDELVPLPESISTTSATDMPTTVIAWRDGDSWLSRSVYGPVSRNPAADRYLRTSTAPEAFVSAVEKLRGFEPEGASDWKPEVVELMLGPFDHSRREPIPWPSDWPGWDSPGARRPSMIDGNPLLPIAGRIFIDGACWEQAIELRRSLDGYTAVVLEGRKYSFGVRPVLPAESEWLPSLPDSH